MDDLFPSIHLQANQKELYSYFYHLRPKLTYAEIVNILNSRYNYNITERNFKEYCKRDKLSRRSKLTNAEIDCMVDNELGRSASLVGYRQMTDYVCLRYGVQVSRESVRKSLIRLDPDGVNLRKRKVLRRRVYQSKGPFDVFHIDGHDKLKQWGFTIHGCMDGFSRKIVWLVCCTTNNDPVVVVNHFLNVLHRYKKTPTLIRADRGTENIYVKRLQRWLSGRKNSFIYGRSVRNQRIESFWSRLKRFLVQWWIDFFKLMENMGILDIASEIHATLLLFCFMPVVQLELEEFRRVWNLHRVRRSAEAPGGRPETLFSMPESTGFISQGIPVSSQDLQVADTVLRIDNIPITNDEDLYELLKCYVVINDFDIPIDAEGALDLYVLLLQCLHNDGF